jgi:hypothetical protein
VSDSGLERYINMLPVDWRQLVAMGVSHLAEELNAEKVNLTVKKNGVSIDIVCDEQGKEEAVDFWKNNVQPALRGES